MQKKFGHVNNSPYVCFRIQNKTIMKTLKDLFELVATATEQNREDYRTWFFNFSGHVNKISVKFYDTGWKRDGGGHPEEIDQTLDEEGIQALYWFIKTRLK
jgi:hypothetical protein